MRLGQTFLALVPTLFAFLLLAAWGELIGAFAIYAPRFLIVIPVLAFLPLTLQLLFGSSPKGQRYPHPAFLVLPLGVLLIFPLWSAGERVAKLCPSLCTIQTHLEVKPVHPGKLNPTGTFSASASGTGNASSYEFSLVTLGYPLHPNHRRKDALDVRLPQWDGCYTNSYTTFFPVTRETIREYVQDSDDFPEGEVEAVADRLWTLLHDLDERRNMPPFVFRDWKHPPPRIVYWVKSPGIFLGTIVLILPVLLVVSWVLTFWPTPTIQKQQG